MRATIRFCLSIGLAAWAPVVLASPIERGGPMLPVTPRPAAAYNEWDELVLKALAGNAGDAEAQAALGVMYAYGDGLPQDWSLAVEWSRKAADQGNAWAQANLGLYL